MNSYDMNGNKQSFANWVSLLRTYETPFINLVKTEKVNHVLYSWQTDKLAATDKANQSVEGSDAVATPRTPTKVMQNVTQILSKVVKVSDTAAHLDNWGRGKETAYQMEKAAKEIFKDLEWAFLNNTAKEPGNNNRARITAGVRGLAADIHTPCPVTGAVTHHILDKELTEDDLFGLTYNLYLAGSKANMICFHPSMALFFSGLQESETKARIFKNNPNLMTEVYTMVDPLGQRYALLPLRQMPKDVIYAFNAKDFTQMVLRPPKRSQLDRDGSYDKWLFDMEVGLRLSNPYAVGILQLVHDTSSLLMKKRTQNVVHTNAAQNAVDFVTNATPPAWSPPSTLHEVHFETGNHLQVELTSNNVSSDKLKVTIYKKVNHGADLQYRIFTLPSDGVKHKFTIETSIQDSDENTEYTIEVRGYDNHHYSVQQLGKLKLVKKPTP